MDDIKLFLSYNSSDRPMVVAVKKLLVARGITTFLDRDQLVPGMPWPPALEEALRGVRAVAVFIGRELGGWQKREMWFALDRQVREEKEGRSFPVIPVLLPGADLTPGFLFLSSWIDLRSDVEALVTAESLDVFERAINATEPAPASPERGLICPYRGLESFREEDAAFFAGRTKFATDLLGFTLDKSLVAVVGPSGSGKSSVVQAGLVPLLRRRLPPNVTWDVATFTPGSDPFHRFASALISHLEPDLREADRLAEANKLGNRLSAGEIKLGSVVDRMIEKSNGTGRLLFVADQFEELFTLTPEGDRKPFVSSLLGALGKAPFTLLLTLRADFYSQIITLDRELSDRLAPAQINIGALTRDELRVSITKPAELVRLKFEAGLVDRILDEVGNEPGNLPLLEYALTGLWSTCQGSVLTNGAYSTIGGVTGALAQRAESEFARFSGAEQTAARRLFSRLVRVAKPEEGTEDTRQRVELDEADAETRKVAQALAGSEVRLLVTGRPEPGAAGANSTVEVAHEALIRNWERLRGWLNEDREFLLWRQRTQIQGEQWEQHGRDDSLLLRGVSLSEAERWLVGRPQDLSADERRFVEDAVALREQEKAAEERRRQFEIETANRLKKAAEERASDQTRNARRLRALVGGLGGLLLLAICATVFASYQRAVSYARQLVVSASLNENTDPELSVLFSAMAVRATWPWAHKVLPEAEDELHRAILESHVQLTLRGHGGGVSGVAWSPDGKRLAAANVDGTAKVWDAASGQEVLTLSGHNGRVYSVAWSPDGKRLATASEDQTAKVWDVVSGRELLTLHGHNGYVVRIAWSPDGKRLATASLDHTARLWDAESGQAGLTLRGHKSVVRSVAWSPDGKWLATASADGTAKTWDAVSGKEVLTLSHGPDTRTDVSSVAWSPDGKRLATTSIDGRIRVWNTANGEELLTLSGHAGNVESVVWSPSGRWLATASWDLTAKVWDVGSGRPVFPSLKGQKTELDLGSGHESLTLKGHTKYVLDVAWSPDGKRLATASSDGTVKVWDLAAGEELLTLTNRNGTWTSVAWSPDSKRLATPSFSNTPKIWDVSSGKQLLILEGHTGEVVALAWSPDTKRLATASDDQTAKVWDAADGREVLTLRGHSKNLRSVAWGPDGKRLATSSQDNTAKVWDAASGKELLTLEGHKDMVGSITWSPDGKRLATASHDNTAKVWDAASGKELLTLRGHNSFVYSVAWSPDGKRLATASGDETAKMWDAASGKEVLTLRGHANDVYSVAWSPDGKRLATASDDNTAKVWDAASGKELLTLRGHNSFVYSVAWSPDGKRLATTGDDTVRIYAMEIRDLMELARQRVTAYRSDEGCRKYLGVDKCPPVPDLPWW
jgi:WD40 repeat protein